jgi:queuine tRNA-ribosyltransferase
MQLSMRWAKRSKEAFVERPGHGLFGINQGGAFPTLRAESAAALTDIGFDGYALGGLAVGEERDVMFAMIEATVPLLPAGKPRYLMGVGKPADLVGAVARGVDMFDCVLPTRSGRTGQAFTPRAAVNQRNAEDTRPLDDACGCPTCRQYTRAYLHHLVRSGEILASILLTWHNLHYYQDLMAGMRAAIEAGSFEAFAAQFATGQQAGDIEPL